MSKKLIDEIRERLPKLAMRADAGSREAAIRLFCLYCMGDNVAEVRRCTATDCPLYPFRLSRQAKATKIALAARSGASK